MKISHPYRECIKCAYIEDCRHPLVNQQGQPVPPDECEKRDEIKLTRRLEPNPNLLTYGRP
jgi:hypothetical protein